MTCTSALSPCGDDIPCGEQNKKLFAELDQYIDELQLDLKDPRRMDTLIMTLHRAQKVFGFLPEVVQIHIACRYGVPHAHVSGVISFYNYFTVTPKGKVQINVCMGTACYVNGSEKVLQEFEQVLNIKAGEVTQDGKFSIESLRCVGACGLAPVVTINSKVYGKVKVGDVRDILEKYLIEEITDNVEVSHA
jgi:NADH:ubiquinone oxidoreductase subunit E